MDIKPIRSSRIQDNVYDHLLEAILSGSLPPGQRITMEGLANIMDVSIMPVRVALQRLEVGGFVTIGKNRRIRISELSQENLFEILEIRLLLECYAAEKACKTRSEAFLKRLEKIYRLCTRAKDENTYLQANREFHMTIYAEAKKPILMETIDTLWNRYSPYLHILLRNEQTYKTKVFHDPHGKIIEAMKDKDPKAIRKWLAEDLWKAADIIKQGFKIEGV
ncbi:GntR family transcriptional regulator [Thermodesulfobacteriota bacterium]